MAPHRRTRVVIVGSGLGGLAAERALRREPVEVTLIDAHNYSTFQPLLFEAAVGVIVPEDVVRPIRSFLGRERRSRFRLGQVTGIDWSAKQVLLADGEALPFDYLILAPGVETRFGPVDGADAYAVPLKTVTDAARIRNSILRSFETAAAYPDRPSAGATSVALIGGGASGVELAGYLSDVLFRSFAKDYPQIPPGRMRVTVVEQGDRVLPGFDPRLSDYAEAALRSRGIDVRVGAAVRSVGPEGITLESGDHIPASTVVWAGGVSAPGWLAEAGLPIEHGRAVVGRDLRLADHPEAFVVGDAAAVRTSSGALRPQVAQVAVQGGRHAARQIARLAEGRPTQRFRYFDKGTMAMVGVYAAVVQSGRVRLSGRLAWAAWGLLHVAYLPGMVNRLRALQTWNWWHVTHEASARVLIEAPASNTAAPTAARRALRPAGKLR